MNAAIAHSARESAKARTLGRKRNIQVEQHLNVSLRVLSTVAPFRHNTMISSSLLTRNWGLAVSRKILRRGRILLILCSISTQNLSCVYLKLIKNF